MQFYDWNSFLRDWNEVLLTHAHDIGELDTITEEQDNISEQTSSSWFGFAPASEQKLYELEQRLQTQLPPSYRSFLLTSNGFRQPGNTVPGLFSLNQVDWYRNTNQKTIDIWLGGLLELREIDPASPAISDDSFEFDLPFMLQISAEEEMGSAVYLLNPKKVSVDGEWEAIYFAHWIPGAYQYESFWELMQAELHSLEYIFQHNRGEPTPHVDPSLGVEATDLNGLLDILVHGNEHQQKLALDALGNLRDLRAFESIAQILTSPKADLFVREHAARSLGMLHDPRSAPLLIEVYRQPMNTTELTTDIVKSIYLPFLDTALPSMPLDQFINQANSMFGINLNLGAVSNGIIDYLRHAIRQGLCELGKVAQPTLEQVRHDADPQISALANDVLNIISR